MTSSPLHTRNVVRALYATLLGSLSIEWIQYLSPELARYESEPSLKPLRSPGVRRSGSGRRGGRDRQLAIGQNHMLLAKSLLWALVRSRG